MWPGENRTRASIEPTVNVSPSANSRSHCEPSVGSVRPVVDALPELLDIDDMGADRGLARRSSASGSWRRRNGRHADGCRGSTRRSAPARRHSAGLRRRSPCRSRRTSRRSRRPGSTMAQRLVAGSETTYWMLQVRGSKKPFTRGVALASRSSQRTAPDRSKPCALPKASTSSRFMRPSSTSPSTWSISARMPLLQWASTGPLASASACWKARMSASVMPARSPG